MTNAQISLEQDRILVSGEVDFSTAASLWKNSLPLLASLPRYIFDFSKITSANSACLALLLEWMKYAKSQGKSLEFVNLPEKLVQIAKLGGVSF